MLALLGSLPVIEWQVADRGYDADGFRDALKDWGVRACIQRRKSPSKVVRYDRSYYKRRNRIEIMSGRLKDCAAFTPAKLGVQRPSSQLSRSQRQSPSGCDEQ